MVVLRQNPAYRRARHSQLQATLGVLSIVTQVPPFAVTVTVGVLEKIFRFTLAVPLSLRIMSAVTASIMVSVTIDLPPALESINTPE